jgi:hypothetical protein
VPQTALVKRHSRRFFKGETDDDAGDDKVKSFIGEVAYRFISSALIFNFPVLTPKQTNKQTSCSMWM